MADLEYASTKNQEKITVSPGTPRYIVYQNGEMEGMTITAIPGSNTALVEESSTPIADIRAGNGVFQAWAKGSVTATTRDVFRGAGTGLRLTATGGDVEFEIVRIRK